MFTAPLTAPRDSQPDHPASYHLCNRALSVPRAKTSILPLPQETADGSEVSTPPKDSQTDHWPSHHLCQSALSFPRTKISKRPGAQEETSGPELNTTSSALLITFHPLNH